MATLGVRLRRCSDGPSQVRRSTTSQACLVLGRPHHPSFTPYLQQGHRCPRQLITMSSSGGNTPSSERQISIWPTNISIGMQTYVFLELVVLLVQLGLADAAYSGDWSRIGVITTEMESKLQVLVNFIIVAHALVGLASGYIAQQRGGNVGIAVLKGFVFGSMGLYEIWQDDSHSSS